MKNMDQYRKPGLKMGMQRAVLEGFTHFMETEGFTVRDRLGREVSPDTLLKTFAGDPAPPKPE